MKTLAPLTRSGLVALIAGCLVSCTDTAPTEVEADVGPASMWLGKGGKPGGGGGPVSWAFAVTKNGNVKLVSFEGSETRSLVKGGNVDRWEPTFTADGKHVVYLQFEPSVQLRIVGIDGTGDRLLHDFDLSFPRPNGTGLQWLPGSSRLIFRDADNNSELAVLDTVSSVVQSLDIQSLFAAEGLAREPAAGPDLDLSAPGFQGWMAFSWWDFVDQDQDLYVVRVNEDPAVGISLVPSSLGRLELPDPSLGGGQNLPAFSPDGSRIAFLDDAHCCSGTALKVVTFDGTTEPFGTPITLVADVWFINRAPVWAPDGSWIAYSGPSTGKRPYVSSLWRIQSDGNTGPVEIVTDKGTHVDWNPAWVEPA